MTTSLAAKYRPVRLDQVLGQNLLVRSLKQAVSCRRHHTFCFTGAPGVGKTTLARILASEFAGGKAEQSNVIEVDAASRSTAESMRELVHKADYLAMGRSITKTFIIDEAHKLSSLAWAVLLKPTEEPPAHVFWVLCTTDPSKVPSAIMTRCLRYDLKEVGEDDLTDLVAHVVDAEGFDIAEDVFEVVVEEAHGSPRQALVNLEGCLAARNANEARSIIGGFERSPEIIDLCRFLINPQGRTWQQAVKIVNSLDGAEPETIRVTVLNYLASALLKTNTEERARSLLGVLEVFSQSYNKSEKVAPLLRSVGLALGLDR